MVLQLAQIVAEANITRLSLIGLSKNVGKTTTTRYLVETLLREERFTASELALTSMGLDGEATDMLTGLPKPRYAPQAGMLIATTANFLQQAEDEGAQVERLRELPYRTALGQVTVARMRRAGRVVIAGPTLLQDMRHMLTQMSMFGARLSLVDGAINRLGAASPTVSNACILCTGTSAGGTPAVVARRTADVLARLCLPTVEAKTLAAYQRLQPQAHLFRCCPEDEGAHAEIYAGTQEPAEEAGWLAHAMALRPHCAFILRGALNEELARELLARLSQERVAHHAAELVVGDATKIFCHSVTLERLAARALHVRVAEVVRVLALTMNPYTPEYTCTSEQLLTALDKALPEQRPAICDVVAGVQG